MRFTSYLLAILAAAAPASVYAWDCQQRNVQYLLPCDGKFFACKNGTFEQWAEPFDKARRAFKSWVEANSEDCAPAAWCDAHWKSHQKVGYTWRMNCFAGRIHKTTYHPAPQIPGLQISFNTGFCDIICRTRHFWDGAYFTNLEACDFNYGECPP